MNDPNHLPATANRRGWLLPAVLAVLLVALVAWPRFRSDSAPEGKAPAGAPAEVTVSLDKGLGEPAERTVTVRGGTALSALQAAALKSPEFAPEVEGSGSSALVTSIGGVANEGSGQRNWTYKVNGQSGVRSAALTKLRDGDRVLWIFGVGE